jgi:septum site-determining protein MinD
VPDDEAIVASSNRGEPASADGKSSAGLAFKDIARRLMGETVPINDYSGGKGFFSKIRGIFGGKN